MVVFLLIVSFAIFGVVLVLACSDRLAGLTCIMFCLYHILFLIIPALLQIAVGNYPFYGMRYPAGVELDGALQVFIFSLCFFIGYINKLHRKTERKAVRERIGKMSFSINIKRLWMIYLGCILLELAVVAMFGLSTFIVSRSEFDPTAFGDASFIRALIISIVRSVAGLFLILVIYTRHAFSRVAFCLTFSLSLIGFAVIDYPLALSRFALFGYIILFLYLFKYPTFKIKALIVLAFLVGITTVFPVVSRITRGDGKLDIPDAMSYLSTSGDFDGFQSILNVQMYVNSRGHTYGHQLLGAVFVLVPRAIWPTKAQATGEIAAEAVGYKYTNISSPLISEIFIDFGLMGLAIFGYIIGVLIRRLDFLSLYMRWKANVPVVVLIGAVTAQLIILSRGALIAVLGGIFIQWALFYFSFRFAYRRL